MIRKNASGRENFRVERVRERKKERECPNLLAFQGYYKSYLGWKKTYFFRKLNFIHDIHFLKMMCLTFLYEKIRSPIPEEYSEKNLG